MRVNLKGLFLMMKHAIPLMVEGGGGAIVNVSATLALAAAAPASRTTQRPRPGCYSSPRRQRWSTARAVCVNAICPSVIDTPTFQATTAGMPKEILDGLLSRQGIRRLARAEEVAAAAVFLASDDASYLTGAVLPADGGYLAG